MAAKEKRAVEELAARRAQKEAAIRAGLSTAKLPESLETFDAPAAASKTGERRRYWRR